VHVDRAFDARFLNKLANHPDIRPWVADAAEGVLDLTKQVENRENVLLQGAYGACMLFKLIPGIYEVHSQVEPQARGPWSLGLARAVLHWMFTRTDAYEVVTRVPRPHKAAKGLSLAAGMHFEFTREEGCRFQGEHVPVDVYSIRIQDWVSKAQGLEEVGRWFHERLHAEARRVGITKPAHADDQNHNQFVGACWQMAQAGQLAKAVLTYNRWSQIARHAPIELVSLKPPIIKMDIGLLKISQGYFEVEPC